MAGYGNNKGKVLFSPKFLALCFILCAGIFLWWMLYPDRVSSGPYLDSAHGNSYGVLRTSLSTPPNNYGQGNCAHCHEQHASIGGAEPAPNSPAGPDNYLLFMPLWVQPVQSNLFCYGCHTLEPGNCGTGGTCQSSWQRTNYSYSYWRGGDTTLTCPNSIYKSFQFVDNSGVSQLNCLSSVGSSHLIYDIGFFTRGQWGFSSTGAYLNPCDVCHNPHRAKRDYPCSRPSAHANLLTWNVWGDDGGTSERMNVASSNLYWAPKRMGSGYEPDGTSIQDGSNMPSYAYVCSDCHNITNIIYSTRLKRNLYRISWIAATGDHHGGRARDGCYGFPFGSFGDLLEPYKVGGNYPKGNYLLNCTDCHEPHGSPNEFLLRPTLNGYQANVANGGPFPNKAICVSASGSGCWYWWCMACHTSYFPTHYGPSNGPSADCSGCHRHCDVVTSGSVCF